MDLEGRDVLLLGGTGLVGMAVARQVLPHRPGRLVVGGLREAEAREAVEELSARPEADGVEIVPEWGDVFLRQEHGGRDRADIVGSAEGRAQLLEDLFGPLDEGLVERSELCAVLRRHEPDVLVDCINTATAIAYQDIFSSAKRLRRELAEGDGTTRREVETHLSSLYLPQLIRHIQLLMEGMSRAGTSVYVKIGTSGTGGMGLNIPFTHSEERPSPTLLAKASVAGAHSLLLFLMGRTPGAPAVKELKPTAAIAWKEIRYGPVRRGGEPIPRCDATQAVALQDAFGEEGEAAYRDTGEELESVYLDAGENGLFSLSEYEAISSLKMMEVITPEEIAEAAIREIEGRPTGHDVVAALDGASLGPTYRAGVLRESALRKMEELTERHGARSVAFEMLGPPRLSKLLFEAALLEELFPDLEAVAGLDAEETAERAARLIREDDALRSDIVSVGIPILLPGGGELLRGPDPKVRPDGGSLGDVDRLAARGWVDLRPEAWRRWARRAESYLDERVRVPGPEDGSREDLEVRGRGGAIRPGLMAAHVFRGEDGGARIKR